MALPFFSSGNTELTADMLNAFMDFVQRQSTVMATPPLEVRMGPDGWCFALQEGFGFWARIQGEAQSGRYGWVEVEMDRDGQFQQKPSGRRGETDSTPLIEANKLTVPSGTVVWATASMDSTGILFYSFNTPKYEKPSDDRLFWAEVTGEADGTYGFREVRWNNDRFLDREENARIATAGQDGAAIESDGVTGIPVGTIVLMFHDVPQEGVNGSTSEIVPPVFRYGGATSVILAKITGRSLNTTWKVDLKSPTGGWFWLSITDNDYGQDYETDWILFDADTDSVKEAIEAVIGGELVRVTSEEEGIYIAEFVNDLGGERDIEVAVNAEDLEYASDEEEGAERPEATVTLQLEGRSDPYTNGKGAYGWLEMEYNSDMELVPKQSGRGSNWPYKAAHEINGETKVPIGSIVRVRTGPVVMLDNDGIEVADQRYLFQWSGDVSQWAMIGVGKVWTMDLAGPTGGWFNLKYDLGDAGPFTNDIWSWTGTSINTAYTVRWFEAFKASGVTGAAVPANATPAQVQAALEAAYPILAGNIQVGGANVGAGTVTIEFINDLAETCMPAGFSATFTVFTQTQASDGPYSYPIAYNAWYGTAPSGGGQSGNYPLQLYPAVGMLPNRNWPYYNTHISGSSLTIEAQAFKISVFGFEDASDIGEFSIHRDHLTYAEEDEEAAEEVAAAEDEFTDPDQEASEEPVAATGARLLGSDLLGGTNCYRGNGSYIAALMESGGTTIARVENRFFILSVVEAGGRANVPAGTVARVHSTGMGNWDGTTEPIRYWSFFAPESGFWAKIVSGGQGTANYTFRYHFSRNNRAYASTPFLVFDATEMWGCQWVPANAIVWMTPVVQDVDGSPRIGYRFAYSPREEVRAIYYLGGFGAGDLSGINGRVDSSSGSYCQVEAPTGMSLNPGFHYLGVLKGFTTSGSQTIPVYRAESWPAAKSGYAGLISTSDQKWTGNKTFWSTIRFLPERSDLSPPTVPWGNSAAEAPPVNASNWRFVCGVNELFFGANGPTGKFGIRYTGYNTGATGNNSTIVGDYVRVLAEAVTADAVTITLSGSITDYYSYAPYVCKIDNELILVTAFLGHSRVTVQRGYGGTTAASHAQGTAVLMVQPYGGIFAGSCQQWDQVKMDFYTDRPGFSLNGVAGASASVTLPHLPDNDFVLEFDGGILKSATFHPNDPPGFNGSLANAAESDSISVSRGVITSAINGP